MEEFGKTHYNQYQARVYSLQKDKMVVLADDLEHFRDVVKGFYKKKMEALKHKVSETLTREFGAAIEYIAKCSKMDGFSWSLFRLDFERNFERIIRELNESIKKEEKTLF